MALQIAMYWLQMAALGSTFQHSAALISALQSLVAFSSGQQRSAAVSSGQQQPAVGSSRPPGADRSRQGYRVIQMGKER